MRFRSGYFLNIWGTRLCLGEIDWNFGSANFLNMLGGGSIWSCLVCVGNVISC
jgi:hypothetical protein